MSQKIRSSALVLVLSALFVSSAYALPPAHAAQGLLAFVIAACAHGIDEIARLQAGPSPEGEALTRAPSPGAPACARKWTA